MNIQVIRSARKSISIEITKELEVIVRAPLFMSSLDIQSFVNSKAEWIQKHIEIQKERIKNAPQVTKFTKEELQKLADEALELIPKRTAYFAELIGVKYNRITIRNQVSRWGSCSSKNNLNFNCLLMLCPPEVRDYVIIHELCHIKEMNHSAKFWELVEKYCPEYKKHKSWLKINGKALIDRL